MARNLFVAGHGKVLVQADYSQLELRVAAALSGDTKMLEIFNLGVDYHQRTAEMVSKVAWDIPPEQVEKKHRTAAKSINFGLLYGRGDGALAEQMGSTREDAAKVRAAVLGNFRKLAADIEASIKMARQTGEVWTSWDGQPARRRSMVGIADPDDGLKSAAERQSYNTRVQGSASDLCLTSVAQIVQWIVDDCVPAKLVMTVHDSILVECDKSVQDEVVYQMRRIMESQPCGGVPIVVDVEVGDAGELLVGALRLKRPVGQVGRTKQCRLRSVAVALRPVTRRALRQEQRLRRGHRIGAVCHRRRRARGLLAGVVRWAPLAQV